MDRWNETDYNNYYTVNVDLVVTAKMLSGNTMHTRHSERSRNGVSIISLENIKLNITSKWFNSRYA